MKINFVDLKRQYESIKDEIDPAIQNVIENASFIMGPDMKEFEKEFAKFCGAKHCIGVDSGTTALSLAIKAIGIKPGDEVITVPNTFIATTLAVSDVGAKLKFVDIDPHTYNMSPDELEKAISEKTKLIIPVHLYGQCCDMDQIMKIADKHNIPVLEDACQAHGADFKGKKAGTFGIAGCFSFYPGKNLGAYGDGGAVITDDDQIAESIEMLRNYGQKKKYYHSLKGHNHRLDSIQAAVLRVKLKHLDSWNRSRNKNAQVYNKHLKKLIGEKVIIPYEHGKGSHIYHLYVIRVPKDKRDGLIRYLAEKDIYAGIHYPIPIHMQDAYKELQEHIGKFPLTEKYAEEIVSLPMFPELTEEEIMFVCENIKEYLNK